MASWRRSQCGYTPLKRSDHSPTLVDRRNPGDLAMWDSDYEQEDEEELKKNDLRGSVTKREAPEIKQVPVETEGTRVIILSSKYCDCIPETSGDGDVDVTDLASEITHKNDPGQKSKCTVM